MAPILARNNNLLQDPYLNYYSPLKNSSGAICGYQVTKMSSLIVALEESRHLFIVVIFVSIEKMVEVGFTELLLYFREELPHVHPVRQVTTFQQLLQLLPSFIAKLSLYGAQKLRHTGPLR